MNYKVNIRRMKIDDINEVVEIEKRCFPTPWTFNAFNHELKKNKMAIYFVAELDGKVVGYCGAWHIVDEFHITNVAVHPDFRGFKAGKTVVETLIENAYTKKIARITLEVRRSNLTAQTLYKDLGFKLGGVRKEYYDDNREDALIMWKELNS